MFNFVKKGQDELRSPHFTKRKLSVQLCLHLEFRKPAENRTK